MKMAGNDLRIIKKAAGLWAAFFILQICLLVI